MKIMNFLSHFTTMLKMDTTVVSHRIVPITITSCDVQPIIEWCADVENATQKNQDVIVSNKKGRSFFLLRLFRGDIMRKNKIVPVSNVTHNNPSYIQKAPKSIVTNFDDDYFGTTDVDDKDFIKSF